jgi:hypothetical protein
LLDSLHPGEPKTKALAQQLETLLKPYPRKRRSVLLIDSSKQGSDGGEFLRRAGRNLPGVNIVPQIGANVYDILKRDVLVITREAADQLAERLQAPINRLGASGRAYAKRLQERLAARQLAVAHEQQQAERHFREQQQAARFAPLFAEADREQLT